MQNADFLKLRKFTPQNIIIETSLSQKNMLIKNELSKFCTILKQEKNTPQIVSIRKLLIGMELF
jgi:hypothetical protein